MHSDPVSDTSLPAVPIAAPHGAGLANFALAIGGLAIGTGEFASMSILPIVATDLHTDLPHMGHMISAYALGVVFGAPLIAISITSMAFFGIRAKKIAISGAPNTTPSA